VHERGSPVDGFGGGTVDAMASLAAESFCYVTTVGRVSGRSHRIEIWFALQGATLYLLSGGGRASDWVRNLEELPQVTVRIGQREFVGQARIISASAEDRLARESVLSKYQTGYRDDLSGWGNRALPVAIDLHPLEGGGGAKQ
jgi:deazaflavin-dependent oxidoreductase (nitroreductase family)